MFNESIANQMLDAAAAEWPHRIDNYNHLAQLISVPASKDEVMSTLHGLDLQRKISFSQPIRVGDALREFTGLIVTALGRSGRENLAAYNRQLADKILREAARMWPDSLGNLGDLRMLVADANSSDEDWLKSLLALNLQGEIDFETPVLSPNGLLRGFVGLRTTEKGRQRGMAVPDDEGGFLKM